MDVNQGGLDPREFAASAERAVAACKGLDAAGCATRLAEDGLLGVIGPEAVGGLGLPLRFALPVMRAAGAGDLAFPLLETMLLARHLAAAAPDIAAGLVAGAVRGTIAWAGTAREDGTGAVRAPMAQDADWILVRRAEAAVLVPAASVAIAEAVTLDETVPEQRVQLQGGAPACHLSDAAWAALAEDAQLLRASAILGAAETCLAMAVEHVCNRRQFGKPLVANQAMRHLLARQKLALEGISGCIARATSCAEEEAMIARQAAFLAAATHGPLIAEAAIQAHGGMGFTWDVPAHRYLRRIRALSAQGEAAQLREAVAAALIDAN